MNSLKRVLKCSPHIRRFSALKAPDVVNVRETRLAYADIIVSCCLRARLTLPVVVLSVIDRDRFCDQGEDSLNGKLMSAGPILERIDIFGAAVAEK